MRLHGPFAHGGDEDFLGLGGGHEFRQGAGMIHFHMVDDEIVHRFGLDQMGHPAQHLVAEAGLDRIKQRDFLVLDEKGIVGRPGGGGHVAVEVAALPIDGTHPMDVLADFHRSHAIPRLRARRRACVNRSDERLYFVEFALGRATGRADPVLGQVFELGTGLNPVVGIALGRIVDVATNAAFVLVHGSLLVWLSRRGENPHLPPAPGRPTGQPLPERQQGHEPGRRCGNGTQAFSPDAACCTKPSPVK